MTETQRFLVRSERKPEPPPTGFRRMYEVVDTGTSLAAGSVVRRFWNWGEADRYARNLNQRSRPRGLRLVTR